MLAARRLDPGSRRAIGQASGLSEAVRLLGATSYGHRLHPNMSLVEAQHAIGDTTLWHLRILAGWLPPRGGEDLRVVAGWFEMQNLTNLIVGLAYSRAVPAPYRLGSLGSAWPQAAAANSLSDLVPLLAVSEWQSSGGTGALELIRGIRLGWGRRISEAFSGHPDWGHGFEAVELAKDRLLEPSLPGTALRLPSRLDKASRTTVLDDLRSSLPRDASWVLTDIDTPDDLGRAEDAWWNRMAADSEVMTRDRHLGRDRVIGAAMALLVDCRSTQGMLAAAWRRPDVSEEMLHASA
jgi:hypothetical protein